MLRLFVCADEDKISNNSECIEAKRDYSTSGGTQPKISPRLNLSPNFSIGSGYNSLGFHIPLNPCQLLSSSQSSDENVHEQEDITYHLNNPSIMKQPSSKIETKKVPKLYFSQTKIDSRKNYEKSPALVLSAKKSSTQHKSSQQSYNSIISPETRFNWRHEYNSPQLLEEDPLDVLKMQFKSRQLQNLLKNQPASVGNF